MESCEKLLEQLNHGKINELLGQVYSNAPEAVQRVRGVIEGFLNCFGGREGALFSVPGRTELGGNHTDHQRGKVLCAAVEQDMLCCAAPNGTNWVRIIPVGMPPVEVDLTQENPQEGERNTSAALVRGVAAGIRELGFSLSGFDAYVDSDIMIGSGLSSSAAFEVLSGTIFNHFFCDDELDAVRLAQIGQFAENVYFGKPCGLMDQLGCAIGGVISVDFQDPEQPLIEKASWKPERDGYILCLIDSGSSHADLTSEYSAIPGEMGAVAAFFRKEVLRDVPESLFREKIVEVRRHCGDRAVLRALHFYEENQRVDRQIQLLKTGETEGFLEQVRQSGRSSALWLQNVWAPQQPKLQPVSLVMALGEHLLKGKGAIRVHGGGFGGTVQAYVSAERFADFQNGMEDVFGADCCRILCLREQGAWFFPKK